MTRLRGWGMRGEAATDRPERWGLILAGGDGIRLRPLTLKIAGDDRPKQFCSVVGGKTLLEQTRRRCALSIPPHRTLVAVTRAHERFYASLLADIPARCMVVQPENRGTASAILYAMLRLATMAPTHPVAVFPSDHYVSDDEAFMAHVDAAFNTALTRPDLVILLGITPEGPEVEYGWIEPAAPITGQPRAPCRVRRFWEKPSPALARALWSRGCLWNSFVMVARVPAFLALIRQAIPDLYRVFANVLPAINTPGEGAAIRALYSRIPTINFSRQVLETRPANLAVLRVSGVSWSDLGAPHRVRATLARAGIRAAWIEPAAAQPA